MTADTKAAWKRRALRAEAELEGLLKVREFVRTTGMQAHRERSALNVAIGEIEGAIKAARDYIEGGAK